MCVSCLFTPLSAQQDATVKETTQTVKTYPFSDPDPVADPSDLFYPYFRFDGFSAHGHDQKWKTVELENEYIKLTLYPEIGGKIWGAVDKTTGKEFIYNNHVVKFRDIAMRGPWTSGGIEFNFGIIGHAPTSSTPVDYYTSRKEDGSVSCYISSYEWITRTFWNVEVNLQKDKAYFTTTTTWYNQSSIDQPYYQWMNAGYRAAGNAEFCYPGDHYIGHGGELFPFPINEKGRDLSWYKNNNFGNSKSEHVLGYYNDYYGIYWHDDDFGSVHHASYDEKLGMKIFLWGQAREGGIWEGLLTDTDGQYIELQSGRMYNQPASNSSYSPFKHYAFGPQMTDVWTEYWFPVKGIGGISKASRIGALHVTREGDKPCLAFSPLEALNTTIHIYDKDKEVRSLPLKTQVLGPWKAYVPELGSVPVGNLKITIGNHDLVYSEMKEDYQLNRPKELPANFDWGSVYGLYTQGEQWMNQKVYDKAETYLKQALEKDPYFAPALNRLASLYYQEGRSDEALTLLRKSLSLNAYDGEANYLYGLCNLKKNKADAKDGFSVATYSPSFRSASYAKLAEIYLQERDFEKAAHYAARSLDYNRMNLDARQVLMVVYRKTARPEKAIEQIDAVLTDMPLYHPARFERLALDNGLQSLDSGKLKSLIRNELPFETYIEIATWYEAIGCIDEALLLLSCAESHPIALYKKAYLLNLIGKTDESRQILSQADRISPEMVFPFRQETLEALTWAASISSNWKINYYRGLIYWANKRYEEALNLMETCGNPGYAPFLLSRAKLRKSLPTKALSSAMNDLLEAEQVEMSWRTGLALLNAYTENNEWKKVVETGERYIKRYPSNYYIGLKLAKGYCEDGQYTACIRLLRHLEVLPNEGAYAGREVYRAANLYQAMDFLRHKDYKKAGIALAASKEWPENLGVGKPYDDQIDSRLDDYIQSLIFAGKGNREKASAFMGQVANHQPILPYFTSGDLLTALALRESGQRDEADKRVAAWTRSNPSSQIAQWCIAIYEGKKTKASEILKKHQEQSDKTPWETSYKDVDFDLIVRLVENGFIQ